MADINQMAVNKAVASAMRREKETVNDDVKFQRAMIRNELETNELLTSLIVEVKQYNATMTQIGMPAIKTYIRNMTKAIHKADERAKAQENTKDLGKNVK